MRDSIKTFIKTPVNHGVCLYVRGWGFDRYYICQTDQRFFLLTIKSLSEFETHAYHALEIVMRLPQR